MSFIYSPELAGAFLPGNSLDIDASAPSNGNHTHKLCCWHGKQMEHSRLSRFGVMCKPLTENHGEELLTLWLAGFHARTSALPEKAQESTASAADCGATSPASLVRYDPATHSLKTAQCSLIEDLTGCSVTLPRSGLMRNGLCWERTIAMPAMSAKDASFWPTPTRDSATERTTRYAQGGMPLTMAVQKMMFRTPSAHVIEAKSTVLKLTGRKPTDPQVGLADQVMALEKKKWLTPQTRGFTNDGDLMALGKACDSYEVMSGMAYRAADKKKRKYWPTATATAYKGWSPNHNRSDTDDRLEYTVEREGFSPGQQTPPMCLNPDWVEWLMGWPIGHTALKPLETGRFQEWQQQHSIFC